MLKSTNESLEKRNNEYSKKMEDLETSLSKLKFESKIKVDDKYLTLNTFKSMIEKNKKNFDKSWLQKNIPSLFIYSKKFTLSQNPEQTVYSKKYTINIFIIYLFP